MQKSDIVSPLYLKKERKKKEKKKELGNISTVVLPYHLNLYYQAMFEWRKISC